LVVKSAVYFVELALYFVELAVYFVVKNVYFVELAMYFVELAVYFVELKWGKTHTNMYLEIWDMLILLITGLCVRRIIATEHYSSLCIHSHVITASNTHSCSNSVSKRYPSLMQRPNHLLNLKGSPKIPLTKMYLSLYVY